MMTLKLKNAGIKLPQPFAAALTRAAFGHQPTPSAAQRSQHRVSYILACIVTGMAGGMVFSTLNVLKGDFRWDIIFKLDAADVTVGWRSHA